MIFYTNNGCLTNRWFPTVENGPIDASALTLPEASLLAARGLYTRLYGDWAETAA